MQRFYFQTGPLNMSFYPSSQPERRVHFIFKRWLDPWWDLQGGFSRCDAPSLSRGDERRERGRKRWGMRDKYVESNPLCLSWSGQRCCCPTVLYLLLEQRDQEKSKTAACVPLCQCILYSNMNIWLANAKILLGCMKNAASNWKYSKREIKNDEWLWIQLCVKV